MPSVPVVMISGHGTIETAVEAIKIGAYDFIEKPFKSDRLLLVVARAIEAAQLRRENAELRLRAGGELDLVGASPAINQLRQQIERVAPTGSRVLVTGAAGLRQGGRRPAAARPLAARRRAVRRDQLRDDATRPAGDRAVRLRSAATTARRARSARSSGRMAARCSSTKSPTCRSKRRARSCAPAGADLRAGRGVAPGRGRCPGARLLEPRAVERNRRRTFPRGSVLSAQRRADPGAAAARAARGHPAAGAAFHAARRRGGAHRRRAISARTRWRRCRPIPGRAMCGNCATSSTGC